MKECIVCNKQGENIINMGVFYLCEECKETFNFMEEEVILLEI